MLIPTVSREQDRAQHYVPLQSILDCRRFPDGDWQVLTMAGWQTADPNVMEALCHLSHAAARSIEPAQLVGHHVHHLT